MHESAVGIFMLLLAAREQSPYGLFIAFLLLSLIFSVVERLFPSIRRQKTFRRGYLTDLIYWFFTPLVTKTVTQVTVLLALVPVFFLMGRKLSDQTGYIGFGPISRWPVGLQALALVVVGDLVGYWSHRWFHGKRLWPFHAVHHSSVQVDWLSATRLHPVNDVVTRLLQAVPFLLLGFRPDVLAAYAPFLSFYAIALHANVSWDFGPLRCVLASPRFHRWHHTKQAEGLDKNFAGLLPLWDLIFGTYYMPRGKHPTEFGVDDPVPPTLWGQLLYPFRRRNSTG